MIGYLALMANPSQILKQKGWDVKKNKGEFDQFTGATITPRAVIQQIAATLNYFESDRERLLIAVQPQQPKASDQQQENAMSDITVGELTKNGLWTNNPALVQLLGLCPLLAVTGTVVNALGLGLATMLVLVGSNVIVSLIRHNVNDAVRLPIFVVIIASFVTCTELLMKAFTFELYQILGIFIPLIVTNCAILGRAEAFASKNNVSMAALDGVMMGLGFLFVLLALGISRELLGREHFLWICIYCLALWPQIG